MSFLRKRVCWKPIILNGDASVNHTTFIQQLPKVELHLQWGSLYWNLCVTINSDDPAYFGGYMTDNFIAVAESHAISQQELAQFTRNAINASFINDIEKSRLHSQLESFLADDEWFYRNEPLN